MHNYTNLSNKSKELKEYRRIYVKRMIQEHTFETFGSLLFVSFNIMAIIVGCCLHKDFTTICTYCALASFFALLIWPFSDSISTFIKTHRRIRYLPLSQEELTQNGIASLTDYADFLNEYLERQKCPNYILELINTNAAKHFSEYEERIEYDGFHYICVSK